MATNNDILQMMNKKTMKEVINCILTEYSSCQLKQQSVKSSLLRLQTKLKQLNKMKNNETKNELITNFKNAKYEPPKSIEQKRQSPILQPVADTAPGSSFTATLDGYKQAALDFCSEAIQLRQENAMLKNTKMYLNKKNLKQTNIALLTLKVKNKHILKLNAKKSADLKRARLATSYLRKQSNKLKQKIESDAVKIENMEMESEELRVQVDNLTTQIGQYEAENVWLREMVQENVETFNEEQNCYTIELQECVYSLLQNNVTSSKVSPVIESVLKLAQKTAKRLPSRTTVNNMNVQRLLIAHRQIEEEFSQNPNTCLLSDETSKFGRKYQGFHAADENGTTWCLGVREMATEGSKTVLSTFKQILNDIDDVSPSESKRSEEILLNITSTMSDRAATQIKFNDLLEEFRTDVMVRQIGEAWDTFTDIQKSNLTKLCNFFCSLHVLVHLAEAASAALVQYEKTVFEGPPPPIMDRSFYKATEPGATRLIRTACKAFAAGGDEKSGVHGSFSTYTGDFLKQHHLRSVPLERFRGNRFNILFSSAAHVHFLAEEMKGFLAISANNRLLQAVKLDLETMEYMAGCKALGLVSELITIPLWAQIERTDTHIIDIGVVYREVVNYLGNLELRLHEFVKGTLVMSFVDKDKLKASIYMKDLLNETPYDDKVQVVLSIMIPALSSVTKRLFHDHLDGEIWAAPADGVREKTVATPNHNKFSEMVFGVLDRILREKPNISLIAAESYIVFCHNKTLQWIDSKTTEEKEELLISARKDVKKMRKKFVERKQMIEEERRVRLNAAREKSETLQRQRTRRLETITNEILVWGLWQSEQDVDSAIGRLSTVTDKRAAITAQLRFRKNVLKQTVKDNSVYLMSNTVNGKPTKLSLKKMTDNVKALVRDAFRNERPHQKEDESVPLIVGQNIRHAQLVDDERVWFSGQIISQVPGYPTWYNVKYVGDPAIYSYQLMNDYKQGYLTIVV